MSEPVSPDIPKVPQATSEPQQQAPVVEKIPWWKKPFVRNKTPEPPQQNPNSHVEPTTNDETVAFDKSALERTTAAMKTMYDKGETDHMQGLGDTNANPSSSTELIDMHGFYTPKEQAAITNTQPPRGFYEEIMASGTNAPNTLTQRPDDQPVLDSQGQPVTEYIAQNDPRYTDPKIPDYLKVGTPDYVIRQAKGGNYLNDTDELKRALAAKTFDNLTQAQQNVEAVANPIPEKGSIGFDAWEKLRTANTDLYKIKPKESNDTSEQKQVIWDAKRQEIDKITDRLNKGIDEGIKETVVAFQMNGINTISSCEGHLDHGMPTPSVDVGALNRPTNQFNGEAEIFQNIARAHNMSVAQMRESQTDEAKSAWQEAYTQAYEAGETEEFKTWREKTVQLGQKTENFLNEFNATRDIPPEVKLHIAHTDDGGWIVEAGLFEEYDDFMAELERSNEDKQRLLTARQGEMRAFTDFLKTKYFSQP